MERTVIKLLKNAVEKYSNSTYLSEKENNKWVTKSFVDVDNDSNYLAVALHERGLRKDDKIAILAEGRSNWVISEYGLIKNGCIAVPLSIKLLPDELSFRLIHSESKALFFSKSVISRIIQILPSLNSDMIFIYLDDDLEHLLNQLKLNGFTSIDRFILYKNLIEIGNKSWSERKDEFNKVYDKIDENDVVTISYSSGTTGNPKGIMLSHLNYYANSNDAMNYFDVAIYDRLFIVLPLDHSFAHTVGIYASVIKGLSIHFLDAREGPVAALKNITSNMKEINPHFMLTVPALSGNFMNKIVEGIKSKGAFANFLLKIGLSASNKLNKDGFTKTNLIVRLIYFLPYLLSEIVIFSNVRKIFGTNMRYLVGGGALLDISQQHFFKAIGIPVYQGYGLTEAAPIISANTPGVHKFGTSGKVIPGIKCFILDKNGNSCNANDKGEIVIQGFNVTKGYFKNLTASNEILKNNKLYTGDLGFFDDDDFLVVVGREKALLISHDGEKFSPEEIEEVITNNSKGFIYQTILYCDHKNYTTALITLNTQFVVSYLNQHHDITVKQLLDLISYDFYIFKSSKEYQRKFSVKWIPLTFTILMETFTEQNSMINSTMKMVRYKIIQNYQKDFDFMYNNMTGVYNKNMLTLENLFYKK